MSNAAVGEEKQIVLRPHEVAKVLGLSRPAIYTLLRTGRLPGLKIGDRWYSRRDQLLDALDGTRGA